MVIVVYNGNIDRTDCVDRSCENIEANDSKVNVVATVNCAEKIRKEDVGVFVGYVCDKGNILIVYANYFDERIRGSVNRRSSGRDM